MRIYSLFLLFSNPFLFYSVPFWQSTPLTGSPSPSFARKLSLPGIPNAGKISDSLFRGAQPRLSHLDELKKLGVTTIVDLRSESPHLRERERQQAESLGMQFVSIPVGGFSTPTSAQLARFFTLVRQTPDQKMFVHCEYGEDRTGVFIASYRIAFEHWTPEQAMSEMLAFGFRSHWHPNMANFIRTLPERLKSDVELKSVLTSSSALDDQFLAVNLLESLLPSLGL